MLAVLLPMDLVHLCAHDHGHAEHSTEGPAYVATTDECALCDVLAPTCYMTATASGAVSDAPQTALICTDIKAPQGGGLDEGGARGPPVRC